MHVHVTAALCFQSCKSCFLVSFRVRAALHTAVLQHFHIFSGEDSVSLIFKLRCGRGGDWGAN